MAVESQQSQEVIKLDAVVVGAGFSGLYMLHLLREQGLNVRAIESGGGVGGTWYWNRYPGLRCDSESIYFNYTFSKELYDGWTWTSRFPAQPEILRYLNYVADELDLRKDIQFNTRVESAHFDEESNRWNISLDDGSMVQAKYFITGIGCLSAANIPKFKGLENFKGDWYHTGRWPHEEVDFKGKRVGVIGTGSTGIQAIPVIAKRAAHVSVFQRTPQYSLPARNKPLDPEDTKNVKENFEKIVAEIRHHTAGGQPIYPNGKSALEVTPEERNLEYERLWEKGGSNFIGESYIDILTSEEANETAAEFVRQKIRKIVKDPETAEKLMPTYHIATKRIVMDTDYFETYNRDNVTLVDVKSAPIEEITETGIRTADSEYDLDIIVFATGYDAMTGPLFNIDIRGKNGISLKEKWDNGADVKTYLGLSVVDFPNMFTITGPQSPSVLSNMPIVIEQHVEWVADTVQYMEEKNIETIEATDKAAKEWSEHCAEVANATLYPKAKSWYTNSNIEGKPRGFLIYAGGLKAYREICDEVSANGYEGFDLSAEAEMVR